VNDVALTSISIDLLCLNMFMNLKLNEPKNNKKVKINQTKRELIKFYT